MVSSPVNPNVVFVGILILAIASGVGEYFHIVPSGTSSAIIGAITGGAIYHTGVTVSKNSSNGDKSNNTGKAAS